uniref:Uncharacterized protein n=1 Tax=Oryza meridionalis TaxID=40149 RepID=A0A0E0DEJ5_9ORYZ
MWPPPAAAACICRRGHAKIRLSPPLQTSVEAVAGAVALLWRQQSSDPRGHLPNPWDPQFIHRWLLWCPPARGDVVMTRNIEREQLDMLFKSMAISPLAKWTLHWSLVF